MKNALHVLYTLLLLAASQAGAAETTRLDRFLAGLDSFTAAFEQHQYSESGDEQEKSIGVVYVQRPGKFHWAYWEPYPQLIVSDGRSVWVFDQDLDQVTIRDLTNAIDDSPAAILGGNVDLDRYYVVVELGNSESLDWLELTPRDTESQYSSVRLGFDGDTLSRMILFDNLGQKTDIHFLQIVRNPKLDPSLFTFTPPEGVDVIDSRAKDQP